MDNNRPMGMRRSGICGYMSLPFPNTDHSIEFHEWYNGEGIDFTLIKYGEETKISLTTGELEALFSICLASDMLDTERIQTDAIELRNQDMDKKIPW